MTLVLVALLALNSVLHAMLVARFGVKRQEPVLAYAAIYAALAIAVLLAVPYSLWATLVLSLFGFAGLSITFNAVARDKTLDRMIWILDVIVILVTAYLLFAG